MLNDPVVLVLGGSHLLINGLHISSGTCKDLACLLLSVSSKERAATKNHKRVSPDSTNNSLNCTIRTPSQAKWRDSRERNAAAIEYASIGHAEHTRP